VRRERVFHFCGDGMTLKRKKDTIGESVLFFTALIVSRRRVHQAFVGGWRRVKLLKRMNQKICILGSEPKF